MGSPGELEYSADLFDRAYGGAHGGTVARLLEQIAADPPWRCTGWMFCRRRSGGRLVEEFNETTAPIRRSDAGRDVRGTGRTDAGERRR